MKNTEKNSLCLFHDGRKNLRKMWMLCRDTGRVEQEGNMRTCMDACEYKETTLCCADCNEKDCDLRCEGVEYGTADVDCKDLIIKDGTCERVVKQ